MTERTSNLNIKYLWGLSLKESIAAVFFGVLIALSKLAVRFPLDIPGHTGIAWMAMFTICCLTIRKGRSGTLAGFIAGILAVILFPGKDGLLTFFKYFLPGITMDAMLSLLPFLSKHWYCTAAVSALSHLTKLSVDFISGVILNLPFGFLMLKIKASSLNHLIFGFLGGMLGYIVYRMLPKGKRTIL